MEYYSHIRIIILSFVVTWMEAADIRLDLNNSGIGKYVLYILTEMWKQKIVVVGAQERWWRTDRGWFARTEVLLDRRTPNAFECEVR